MDNKSNTKTPKAETSRLNQVSNIALEKQNVNIEKQSEKEKDSNFFK